MMAAWECTRHFTWDKSHATVAYTVRCMHLGSRFVVEIHSVDSDFVVIDYVEDLPNGDVLVEDDETGGWDHHVAKMLSGRAPRS